MCGFAGFVNLDGHPADSDIVARMMRTIAHRGPDDRAQVAFSMRDGEIDDGAIGFHRLKILDLTDHGQQPMVDPSGTVLLALNGEIYNAFDFTPELEAAGYQFRSRTDAEVVLHLYARYGLGGLLERIEGMFAFAIADLRAHQVHLVRDPFGIKPLYWTQAGASILFASEAKAFLAHPAFTASIDEAHVDEQLAFRYVAGESTLLKGVQQLRPGHRLTITTSGIDTRRYWAIPDHVEKRAMSRAAVVDELGDLLRRSVTSQKQSDVAVGCQLSGGIDSSLVTAAAGGIDTFSVIFEDPKFSEEPWIVEAAASAGAANHRFLFSEDAFIEPLLAAAWHMDQPISHPNALALWLLAEQSRPRVTVLLSGEGADEVFCGYQRFTGASTQSPESFIRATQMQPDSKLARLRPAADLAPARARRAALFAEGQGDALGNCAKYEMQTYLLDLLVRQDKMTMAHGLENRVPFLDRRLVQFARSLPGEHLVANAGTPSTKLVLKELARRTFGAAFADRPKYAFALPLAQYFRAPRFIELMEDSVLPGIGQRGIVSEAAVRALWRRSLSAPALTEVCWIPIAFELWAQQFVDRRATRRSGGT